MIALFLLAPVLFGLPPSLQHAAAGVEIECAEALPRRLEGDKVGTTCLTPPEYLRD